MKISEQFDLTDKVAVLVGGTSGIGSALALGLAEAGADVVATSRSQTKVEKITGAIKSLGRKSMAITTDATNESEMAELAEGVLAEFGKIDILVNAAGINIRSSVIDMTYQQWSQVVKTNLDSVFLGVKCFAQSMIARNYGKIVNIGSLNSVIASSYLCAYAASKGGVVQLTKALAVELAPYGINVNVILPGYFRTEMTEPVISNKVTHSRITERTPMNRIGKLEELVGAVVFLASDASQFVTGETLAVDGGFLSFGVDLKTV